MKDAAARSTRCPSRSATCSTRSRSWTASAPTRSATTASARSPSGQDGGVSTDDVRRALRVRARQRVRQPRQPHAEHDRPLPRRRGARRRRRPRAGRRLRRPAPRRSCELLDRAEITQALERIWQRVRRLNRYVEENAPWKLAKDPGAGGRARHRRCARSPRACASLTVLLAPYMPGVDRASCSTRSATREIALERRASSARRPGGQPVEKLAAALPEAASDRQPHPPRPRARARGRAGGGGARGGRHAHPHDRDGRGPSRRAALAAAETLRRRCSPRSAATRTRPPATTTRSPTSCASSRAHPRCRAIGETGLDDYRDYAPRADQERAFRAQIELARELGKPLVIHTRAAEDDTIATLAARGRRASRSILHCFSMPDRLDECLEHGWWISFAGNVTYPKATRRSPTPPRASRSTACWSRPTRPT